MISNFKRVFSLMQVLILSVAALGSVNQDRKVYQADKPPIIVIMTPLSPLTIEGKRAYDRGDYRKALELLLAGHNDAPSQRSALMTCDAALRLGDYLVAYSILTDGVTSDKFLENSSYMTLRANVAALMLDYNRPRLREVALKEMSFRFRGYKEESNALIPQDSTITAVRFNAWLALGVNAAARHDQEFAAFCFDTARGYSSKHPLLAIEHGMALAMLGRTDEAIRAFKRGKANSSGKMGRVIEYWLRSLEIESAYKKKAVFPGIGG